MASVISKDHEMIANDTKHARSETGGDSGTQGRDGGTVNRTVQNMDKSGMIEANASNDDIVAGMEEAHAHEYVLPDDGARAVQSHRIDTSAPFVDATQAQIKIEHQAQEVFSASDEFARYVLEHDNEFTRDVEGRMSRSIVTNARIMVRNGESRADIHVDPPTLGRMRLELVTENAKVTGRITVENREVRDLVQNSLPELRQQLAHNGLSVESFDVQVGHNGGTDSWAHRERQEYLAGMGRQDGTMTRDGDAQSQGREPRQSRLPRNRSNNSDYLDIWM